MFHVSSPSEVVASPVFCITLYANETYALAAPHNKFTRVEMRCIGRVWNYVLAPPGTHADGNGRGQAPVETVAYNTRSLLEQVTPNCPFVGEPKRLSSSSSSSFSLKHSLGCVVSSKWNFFLLHRSREQLDEEGKGTVWKWWTTFWTGEQSKGRGTVFPCYYRATGVTKIIETSKDGSLLLHSPPLAELIAKYLSLRNTKILRVFLYFSC